MKRGLWVIAFGVGMLGSAAAQEEQDEAEAELPAWVVKRAPAARQRFSARTTNGRLAAAVERGLVWLARHQDEDGRWDCDGFADHDPGDDRCDGIGLGDHDVGVTSLALLAFLGAGYTHRGESEADRYAAHVRRGLDFLVARQDEEGLIRTGAAYAFVYGHAMATLALCEAYGMTRDERYRAPARAALGYILLARNPNQAWRYAPRSGENDTSVTAWCALALHAGAAAGLGEHGQALQAARAWIDKMTDPNFGQVGYNFPGGLSSRPQDRVDRFPPEKSAAMTAAGMLVRILTGEDPRRSKVVKLGAERCLGLPPVWNPEDGSIDMIYWFFASHAMYQVGDGTWRAWQAHLLKLADRSQHPAGAGTRTGSWDPIGVWGHEGGRVYSTALMTLALEAGYRYPRLFGYGG